MMIEDKYEERKEDESVCCVRSTLKSIDEIQNKANLPVLKDVLPETIPIVLYSYSTLERYYAYGITSTPECPLKTCFFRIEKLNKSDVCLSLLRPADEEGNYIDTICIPHRLEKTNLKVTLPINNFCAVQCISPKLVNRRVLIVEQKC
ncbi:CotY/CotZ family spore coat protein [Jeotgalibacillus marinus]|uniref:CotY/CotZ family spore coat protein n=1 Tax=Jeotgalibacillus marinus TaxID=86667 RepID=A0ABV3Q493_9BACL